MNDVRLARLTSLVAVCLISEDEGLLHLLVVLFDIFLFEFCGTRVIVVYGDYLIESFLKILGNIGLLAVVLKIGALSLSLHLFFSNGIKCLVILTLIHLVFSYRPQIH